MTKIIAWFSFGIPMEVEDSLDATEIARKGRPLLIERIESDSIEDCLDNIETDEDDLSPF